MIEVTIFDGTKISINADLIEMVESVPETLITLTTGRKLIVKEPREEIRRLVLEYRRLCMRPSITRIKPR